MCTPSFSHRRDTAPLTLGLQSEESIDPPATYIYIYAHIGSIPMTQQPPPPPTPPPLGPPPEMNRQVLTYLAT